MDDLTTLRADLDRALTRIASLEEIVFRLNPSDREDALDTVDAVRDYLRKITDHGLMSHAAVSFLRSRLPVDWRDLIARHGYRMVFGLLAENYSISEARRKLR